MIEEIDKDYNSEEESRKFNSQKKKKKQDQIELLIMLPKIPINLPNLILQA